MPNRWESPEAPIVAPEPSTTERDKAVAREKFWADRLRTLDDVEAQRTWQQSGTVSERRARAVFDGVESPASVGLPHTDALVAELARSVRGEEGLGQWTEAIEKLRHHKISDGEVDVLKLLKNPATSALARFEWFQKEIAGLLRYTMEKDYAELRDAQTLLEEMKPLFESDQPPEELPPPQQDEMVTSMDELKEDKEGERKGYFSVHPFWGGYYEEDVYETHVGGSRWRKDARQLEEVSTQETVGSLKERRVFRGVVRAGSITALPMPLGFVPDPSTLKATQSVTLLRDQHGLLSVDAGTSKSTVAFTIDIGIPLSRRTNGVGAPTHRAVQTPYASILTKPVLDALSGADVEKARALKRFLQGYLEYSNDHTLNEVYAQHPQGYFAAIEKHKKADCDVANAENNNLCSAANIVSAMPVGHYVKMQDAHGAAIMNSGTRHAWTRVWSPEHQDWFVMDATPDTDPTLDKNRPDERSANEPGPGNYGEQDASQFLPEELDAWRQKLIEAAERAKNKTPEELRNEEFARDAACSVEEATRVRAQIEAARRITDSKGRVVRDHMSEQFQRIVESNFKATPAWHGPVPKSEGDEMDDRVMIVKDLRSGSANPMGYGQEVLEQKLQQEYGGMDVYSAVDRSQSMEEIDPGSEKPKKEEQQLTQFVIQDSLYSFTYQIERAMLQDDLIAPLSVRSGVVAFQAGGVETIRPLSNTWTPKEQFDVWKGLESNFGGGTPANLALAKIRQDIEAEVAQEEVRRGSDEIVKPRLRVVLVFMDGGIDPDKREDFFAQKVALEALGAHVSIWGMTESAREVEGYTDGHCEASVRDMIEPVTEHIIEKALALRAQQAP